VAGPEHDPDNDDDRLDRADDDADGGLDDEDRWFGIFQGFRPDGAGVRKFFADSPDADDLVARIQLVCKAAHHDEWARDAYFVVRRPTPATDEELIAFGRELLGELRTLAPILGQRDLIEGLGRIDRVEVVPPGACDRSCDDHLTIHESLGDSLGARRNRRHPASKYREGYYSVACDYWLGWFLQWPAYRHLTERDTFRPYFELWARGAEIAFQDGALAIARSA
jgi:hypothetical protein